ncbi:lamin tail domain-containing protein [Patescibacteria group bacterium]|nr:lamin tail domain-containing protein [Patescibacteria group bacterium]
MRRHLLALGLLLFLPHAALAAFSFTEIMYDPAGTDSKREWIEILNEGPPVDISAFKLFEGGVNHGLTVERGPAVVPTGGYAIIADDATTFLAEYPNTSGTVLDSAFSLSNTGETLVLRTSGVDVASVSYVNTVGGQNDGKSLAFVGGVWVPQDPTPGVGTLSGGKGAQEEQVMSAGGGMVAPSLTVRVSASGGAIVGVPNTYSAQAFGVRGEALEDVRYVWNFGNGATREGQTVLFAYTLPGTFDASVDVASAGISGTSRFTVVARAAEVVVSRANESFIELDNRSSAEVDVSLWRIVSGDRSFVLPPRTIIRSRATLAFPSEVTGLTPTSALSVVVQYPNGAKAVSPAPEVTYPISKETTRVTRESSQVRVTESVSRREPRVLVAATSTTPSYPWQPFLTGALAATALAACAGLAYIQFKR